MGVKLEVKNIHKNFEKMKAVDGISFEVKSGEIMGILGPNGAGKTSTIRMIMGINAPDKGHIYYNIDNLESERNKRYEKVPKNCIGYLPEERGLYKDVRVMDILIYLSGLKLVDKNTAYKKGEEWLEKFDLIKYKNSKVEELSKGMAQKVQFIASILHEPDLVVLDEPFSGLDPVSQDVFREEIRALADRGTAILISSHRLNMMEDICDRIFLINKGRKVFYGPLTEIQGKYGNYRAMIKLKDFNKDFALNDLDKLISCPELVESFSKNNRRLNLLLKEDVSPAFFANSMKKEAEVQELKITQISLHEIFIKVAEGGFSYENGF